MSGGKSNAAVIFGEKPEGVLEESVRKVATVDVERSLESKTRERLLGVMPALQNHFKVSLDDCQGPDFLKYGVGAFYLAHKDGNPSGPAKVARRRVSAVIFLNAQSREPTDGAYCGGSLTLYGLMDGPEWGKLAFPLEAETGLLVAFRSDVVHEVQPVTFGERFSVVSWFTSNV
jgi:predicted 2-oxoglutarate/Fe(II)-dependent dioxygenase YbiX